MDPQSQDYISKLLLLVRELREEKKRLRRLRKRYRRSKSRREKIEIAYQSENPSVNINLCEECLNFFSDKWMMVHREYDLEVNVCKTCFSFSLRLRRELKAFSRRYPRTYLQRRKTEDHV